MKSRARALGYTLGGAVLGGAAAWLLTDGAYFLLFHEAFVRGGRDFALCFDLAAPVGALLGAAMGAALALSWFDPRSWFRPPPGSPQPRPAAAAGGHEAGERDHRSAPGGGQRGG